MMTHITNFDRKRYVLVDEPITPSLDNGIDSTVLTDDQSACRGLIAAFSTGKGRSLGKRHQHLGKHFPDIFGGTNFSATEHGVYTFPMAYLSSVIASNASGNYNNSFALNPSSAANWTAVSALFDEYRVGEVEIKIVPLVDSTANTYVGGCLAMAIDPCSTAAPSGMSALLQYGDHWFGNSLNPPGWCGVGGMVPAYKYKCAPSADANAANQLGAWLTVANAASSVGSVKMSVQYAPASVNLFAVYVSMKVQLRQVL